MNSTTVLFSEFATHRSPKRSKARPGGSSRLVAVEVRATLATGDPVLSWLGVNSTTLSL